jgi:uncharacterized membrane protein YdjX (TVP38/TMEM64 family)
MKQERTGVLKALAIIFCLAAIGFGVFFAIQWMPLLRDPAWLAEFQRVIASLGGAGWLILLAVQYIQIVIAFIPGGPIQILAGVLYGPLGGLATCVLGILAASATVFTLTKKFGRRVVALFIKKKEFTQYHFIQDESRLERLCFLFYLIPGAPKDALTYLFALTPIPLSRFLILSVVARIPAALTSALAGDSFAAGEWGRALAYFLGLTALSLAGLLLHRKIMAFYHRKRDK